MSKIDFSPLLPLRDIVVFPGMIVPLFVGRDKSIRALNEVMKTNKKIILVTQKNAEIDDPTKEDLYSFGCEGKMLQLLKLPDGTVKVLVEGLDRVKIVECKNDMNETSFTIDSFEGPYNTGKKYESGNMGHRPGIKGGYFPTPPVDAAQDMRGEFLKALRDMGIKAEKHHHEVAPSQHELGMYFDTLTTQADNVQLYKYGVQMVAHSFGKTATFMPKPVKGDNGSGMHTHQSIWKGDTPLFAGNKYAGLSDTALYYIGGILKHAKAVNALSNSTTNSYKRLIPGFEAPVLLVYSARNRSATCRIPIALNKKGLRVEVRYPDAAGNPYLTFAAMLMAGLDGIKNKIDPGKPFDEDLYAMPEDKVKKIPTVCGSLREAMECLDRDRDFLKQDGVFTDDQIDSYIALKFDEIHKLEHTPHPIEFEMYYSC